MPEPFSAGKTLCGFLAKANNKDAYSTHTDRIFLGDKWVPITTSPTATTPITTSTASQATTTVTTTTSTVMTTKIQDPA